VSFPIFVKERDQDADNNHAGDLSAQPGLWRYQCSPDEHYGTSNDEHGFAADGVDDRLAQFSKRN